MPPQTHEPHDDKQPRRIHGHKRNQRSHIRGRPRADDGQGAEIDCEVEVGAREGLDDGEAEEEVAGGDPAREDDGLAQEGDDDGAAAEDDGAG